MERNTVKIAITSSGPTLDSQVDPRFGRAQYLLIVNTETLDLEAIENPNVTAGGGAGVQAAQMVVSRGAEAVLTGNCGPNAYRTLSAADIEIYAGVTGTVRAAVEAFKQGQFSPLSGPSVSGHFGTGQAGDGDAGGAA
jgi:predicted Fe-Mo cluster-binding NifX family protein